MILEKKISKTKVNFLYQSVYQLLILVLPFVTAPYISRILGSSNVGIYSYTNTIANYFVVISMLGIEQYGNRCVAQVRDNKDETSRVFSELLFIHLIVSIIVLIAYIAFSFWFNGDYQLIFLIQGLYVLSAVFDVNWFFFGLENFKLTVIRNLAIKIITIILIFWFVKTENDLEIYCLIMSLGFLASQIAIWFFVPKYVTIKKVPLSSLCTHIKPLLTLFIAIIAAHIYRMMDKVMLGWFNKMTYLGCYEYADKFVRVPLSLITALGTVMLSKMSNLFANNSKKQAEKLLEKSAVFVIYMSVALAFGIAAIAPEFVVIFLGHEYEESIVLLQILAVTIPLVSWNNFVRTQILIPTQQDSLYTKAVCLGATINTILNFILIPRISARGAAIATIVAYICVAVVQTIPLIKKYPIFHYLKNVPFPISVGSIMYIIVRCIGENMGFSWLCVIMEVVVGVIAFILPTGVYRAKTKPEFGDIR